MIKLVTIKIDDEDVEIDVDQSMLSFYKKETNHKKVTKKGLIKFLSNIVKRGGL